MVLKSDPRNRSLRHWPLLMRALSVLLALQLFALPLMVNAQTTIDLFEECGSQVPPVIEEEVLKHACEVRIGQLPQDLSQRVWLLLSVYQDSMLDHPIMEVPHQPPK
jgi:hypothetical protein